MIGGAVGRAGACRGTPTGARVGAGTLGPMPQLTREDVAQVARLARLALTPAEIDDLRDDLAGILDHAADIEALDTTDVEPTAHPLPLVNVLRPDVAVPSLDRAAVLAMAPASEDGRFKVPRILGEAP